MRQSTAAWSSGVVPRQVLWDGALLQPRCCAFPVQQASEQSGPAWFAAASRKQLAQLGADGLPARGRGEGGTYRAARQAGVRVGACRAGAGGEEVPQPPRREGADREQEQVSGGDPLALLPRQPGKFLWRCALPFHPRTHPLHCADIHSDAVRRPQASQSAQRLLRQTSLSPVDATGHHGRSSF